jgi:hypothetical protein
MFERSLAPPSTGRNNRLEDEETRMITTCDTVEILEIRNLRRFAQ